MKIVETRVNGSTIHLWLADDPELQNATQWLEVELPMDCLGLSEGRHSLVELRRAVLRAIRNAVDEELDRLAGSSRRPLPARILERQAQRRSRRA
jgi:hypothetical protein